MPLAHHDLCFGCGLANVFGIQLNLEPVEEGGAVAGRFFAKQDHQGRSGQVHDGILAIALAEAAQLAAFGPSPSTVVRLDLRVVRPAPIGEFVSVQARPDGDGEEGSAVAARALAGEPQGPVVAEARVVVRGGCRDRGGEG